MPGGVNSIMYEERIRVLHVDDEETQLSFAKFFLESLDNKLEIDSVSDPQDAIILVSTKKYDVIISDYRMNKINGIQLAEKIKEEQDTPIILYTGHDDATIKESAFEAGIDVFQKKELDPNHYSVLVKNIRMMYSKRKIQLVT